jgi:hypothetical protein
MTSSRKALGILRAMGRHLAGSKGGTSSRLPKAAPPSEPQAVDSIAPFHRESPPKHDPHGNVKICG